jgi:DNA-binding response OmpR family regulator
VASPEHPVRVVVIDDSVDIRALLSFGLSCAGMDVVGEAGDGSEGVELVREERPDVVLLDLAMPIMDGVEALPLIRELVPDSQIIVFSAFDVSPTDRVLYSGADGHIVKGTSLRDIVAYVEVKLGDRSKRSEGTSTGAIDGVVRPLLGATLDEPGQHAARAAHRPSP